MQKIDYKKELKYLYRPSANKVETVDVPKMDFLMIDGIGNPNTSQDFKDATEGLYALAYAVKFMIKKGELEVDFGVMPLEALWWVDNMTKFDVDNKDDWKWTLMIMQPEIVSKQIIAEAREQVRINKKLPILSQIRYDSYDEGNSAQTLHLGPFSEEGPTIEKVHNFISENGNKNAGKHHEIYLSDIRKAEPAKWRTVIRQPIK
ncbi:MAG: hypothetical protein HN352_16720 [Bacteroidetes bacterium]|jgi:hypothetical protein|nr:hypothetical protein [Bacteroidota bacterium]MBT3750870.1 hypothetical protein [Bacteroidota bacterium]MBT4398109.1 hypothetical protein [Bacteroidota bacterium]MBT4411361.1 hypothetical protein [Bacteroidota bacterium]MBT5426531.1 hypothetical protein [Bacteroidota bacterium]